MKRELSIPGKISRTKLILLHTVLWICFLFFPLLIYKVDIFSIRFIQRDLVNNLFLIVLFYINFYYLIPRFFAKKKFTLYFSIILLCLVVFVMQQLVVEYLFLPVHNQNGPFHPGFTMSHRFDGAARFEHGKGISADSLRFPFPAPGEDGRATLPGFFQMPSFFWIEGIRRTLLPVVAILLTGGFIRVALQWFQREKQYEELEVKKLSVELSLLKAQINPHFLFNSLNTVYSLAHAQSQQTEKVILQLSDILRYVIYESSAKKVLLEKELSYIDNYIDLQTYRLDKNIDVQYEQTGKADGLLIEPMLLIPFIENAFKHGISYKDDSFIKINIGIENDILMLQVSNRSREKTEPVERTGIGIINVRKRLQLAYPNRHQLTILNDNGIYTVYLKLIL